MRLRKLPEVAVRASEGIVADATTVDAADLDDARTETLRSLVAGCSFRERSGPVAPALRDGFSYEVTVDADDDKSTKKTMARRAAPPGYMASPYGAPRARLPDPNESWAGRFYRGQIIAPQYIAGNITILTSLALFAGGVFATRQWGEILTFGI